MAVYSSKDVGFILHSGYQLLGDMTSVTFKVDALTDDRMVLGDSWPAPTALGLSRAEVTQDGFFNDAANASNAILVGGVGVSRVFCIGIEGNTIGKKFTGFAGAMQNDYERLASLDKLHRARAAYRGNGQVDDGIILQSLAAKTANWDTTASSIDNAASSASGGVGYAQVTAFSGFSSVTLKVRHSTDNSSFSDLLSFSAVSSAPTAERATVAGTVNRYLAMSGTVSGSGSITVMVGFKRN